LSTGALSQGALSPNDLEAAWMLLGSVVVDALFELRNTIPATALASAIAAHKHQNPSGILASRRTQLACLLEGPRHSGSRQALLDAVAWVEPMVLDQDIDELERARAALSVAHAWSSLGQFESASAWLESAASLFQRAGQLGWVDAIRQEMKEPLRFTPSIPARQGVREQLAKPLSVRKQASTAPEWTIPLSPAEVRVALVVGSGRSDRESANELFVSVRTIEYHLQSVFRKLGIKNRSELANLVGRASSSFQGSNLAA
jgi:DNA-binding CsgD family transcriptional regulator